MDDRQIGEIIGTESAWAEINPPMASARPAGPPCASSDRLRPATSDQFRDELEACLALVVPVGMDEAARAEWLAVAWATLKHLPADLLASGCQHARLNADHPSKIVPLIVADTQEAYERRQRIDREYAPALPAPRPPRPVMDRRGQPMSQEDTAELNRILEGLGATARYRSNGERFHVEQPA